MVDLDKLLNGDDDNSMIVETMVGEHMDLAMELIKNPREDWHTLSEDMQDSVIQGHRKRAVATITQMVKLIASTQYATMVVDVGTVQTKPKDVVIKATASRDSEHRHTLSDFTGKKAVLVLVDPDDYNQGGVGEPEPDPDQRPLNGFGD